MAVAAPELIIAGPTAEAIGEAAAVEAVVAAEGLDAVGDVGEAAEAVVALGGSTDDHPLVDLGLPPEGAIGEAEGIDAVGGSDEVVGDGELGAGGEAEVEMAAHTLHGREIAAGVMREHHLVALGGREVVIGDQAAEGGATDEVGIAAAAADEGVVAATADQRVVAVAATEVVVAGTTIETVCEGTTGEGVIPRQSLDPADHVGKAAEHIVAAGGAADHGPLAQIGVGPAHPILEAHPLDPGPGAEEVVAHQQPRAIGLHQHQVATHPLDSQRSGGHPHEDHLIHSARRVIGFVDAVVAVPGRDQVEIAV